MKKIIFLLCALSVLGGSILTAQTKYRIDSDDVIQADAWTTNNASFAVTNIGANSTNRFPLRVLPAGIVTNLHTGAGSTGYISSTSADTNYFYRGDGTWSSVTTQTNWPLAQITNAGSIGYQNSNNVSITGGQISNVSFLTASNMLMPVGSALPLSLSSQTKSFTYYNQINVGGAYITNSQGFVFLRNGATLAPTVVNVTNAFLFADFDSQLTSINLTGKGAAAFGSFGNFGAFNSTGDGAFFAGKIGSYNNQIFSGVGSIGLGCFKGINNTGDGSFLFGFSADSPANLSGTGAGGLGYISVDNTGGGSAITVSGLGAIIHGFARKPNTTDSILLSGDGAQAIGFHQAAGGGITLSSTGAVSIGAVTSSVTLSAMGAGSWGDGNRSSNAFAIVIGQSLTSRVENSLRVNIADLNQLRVGSTAAGVTNISAVSGSLDFGTINAYASSNLTLSLSGAKIGDRVAPAWPTNLPDLITAKMISSNNVVWIMLSNPTTNNITVGSGTYRATIFGY